MDPVVVAFGTALIGAMATDTWEQTRDAVTGLWRRVHPGQGGESIGTDLDTLHQDIVAARQDGDTDTERDLEGAWRVRLQHLLRADPGLAGEVQRVLDQVLTPALPPAEQTRVQTIITGTATGHARLTQAGRDITTISGDSYTAGRDQHLHRP